MNRLKIRAKFLILGIIIFSSLLVLSILALSINKSSYENLNSVVNSFKKAQNIQTSYMDDLFTLRENILSLVISPNEDYKKEVDKKIKPLVKYLDEVFLHNSLHSEWLEYKKLLLASRDYALKGFDEGAFMNTSTVERKQFYNLILKLKNLQSQELKVSEQKLLKSKKSSLLNNYYIFATLLFVIFIMILLDMFLVKKTTQRIEKVELGLSKFFEYLQNPSNFKDTIHIDDDKYKDELGVMSKAINKQTKAVQKALDDDYKLIYEATYILNSLKGGEFGGRLSLNAHSKELNELKDVTNEMIEDLERKIQEEIAQRSNQEKLLIQQSKLATMGEMIGNIAHQWRQPISEISVILMELEAITRYSTLEKEKLLQSIALSNRITEHMSTTISDFQNFFKPTKKKVHFSALKACKKALSIIQASLSNHGIALVFDVQEDSEIFGYESEFSHALLNIISNAKDVLVSRAIKNPTITLSIKVGRKFTIIKIEDNAGGIHIKDINTIFEPYFTTKHAKQGTGIGLYMTKMIVETNMNGYIIVKNTSKGALFTIKI